MIWRGVGKDFLGSAAGNIDSFERADEPHRFKIALDLSPTLVVADFVFDFFNSLLGTSGGKSRTTGSQPRLGGRNMAGGHMADHRSLPSIAPDLANKIHWRTAACSRDHIHSNSVRLGILGGHSGQPRKAIAHH